MVYLVRLRNAKFRNLFSFSTRKREQFLLLTQVPWQSAINKSGCYNVRNEQEPNLRKRNGGETGRDDNPGGVTSLVKKAQKRQKASADKSKHERKLNRPLPGGNEQGFKFWESRALPNKPFKHFE
ncbi:hypothetical protein L596_030073 [Steinernema carpocapsae]|uniref:Uncharacterized protein n=1 Tax=Steinernema carpocapsae TaxID=34508 RepID=A0A4U5LRN9_STECR|nr:hypothetical protein L596_030073 [Steinernema carpocapsae]